jgi:hypothetical protein
MRCAFCAESGPWSQLHAHQAVQHADLVRKTIDPDGVRMAYALTCPRCNEVIGHTVKPRERDPGFLKEFEREINLVAFDQYLYHCGEKHPEMLEED